MTRLRIACDVGCFGPSSPPPVAPGLGRCAGRPRVHRPVQARPEVLAPPLAEHRLSWPPRRTYARPPRPRPIDLYKSTIARQSGTRAPSAKRLAGHRSSVEEPLEDLPHRQEREDHDEEEGDHPGDNRGRALWGAVVVAHRSPPRPRRNNADVRPMRVGVNGDTASSESRKTRRVMELLEDTPLVNTARAMDRSGALSRAHADTMHHSSSQR